MAPIKVKTGYNSFWGNPHSHTIFKYDDSGCDRKRGYICERDMVPTNMSGIRFNTILAQLFTIFTLFTFTASISIRWLAGPFRFCYYKVVIFH